MLGMVAAQRERFSVAVHLAAGPDLAAAEPAGDAVADLARCRWVPGR